MFKYFKRKEKQSKKRSKIISEKFNVEDNLLYNIFNNPYCINGTFTILGIDENEYIVKVEINGMRRLIATVYKNNIEIQNVKAYGNFDSNSQTDFYLERIENINCKYKNFGFGTMLMECLLRTLSEYCLINNYVLTRIYGTIGIGGGDSPERSMKLYSSFDNYCFDDNRHLYLQQEKFNFQDRHLEYLIA